MARSSLSAVGVHQPETIAYQEGFLADWLKMFNYDSGEGLLAEFKLRDEAHIWISRGGAIPDPTAAQQRFIDDARSLGFKLFVQYNPWTLSNPLGAAFTGQNLGHLRTAAGNLTELFPDAIIAGPGNEPSSGSWDGTDEDLWVAEATFLRELNRRSHECAGFAYASIVTTVSTARQRFNIWKERDGIPTWWQAHAYGQGGDAPRHIADVRAALLRATGRDIPVIYGEYHHGFPAGGQNFNDRPDLLTAATGRYVADMALKIAAAGDAGVVFTLESMFWPNSNGNLNNAGTAFANTWLAGELQGVPRSVGSADLRTKTFRLLTQHRGPYTYHVGAPLIVQNLTYP